MDGAGGLAAIAIFACLTLAFDLSIVIRPGFPENTSELWSLLALNGVCIGGIFLGIMRRRAHRRIRRLSEGKCPRCGYRLEGIASEKCPECGGPAVRMNIQAEKIL